MAFCPSLALPKCDDERVEFGEGTGALEIIILETYFIFINNLNFKFSPKFSPKYDDSAVEFGGDVQRTEGVIIKGSPCGQLTHQLQRLHED